METMGCTRPPVQKLEVEVKTGLQQYLCLAIRSESRGRHRLPFNVSIALAAMWLIVKDSETVLVMSPRPVCETGPRKCI